MVSFLTCVLKVPSSILGSVTSVFFFLQGRFLGTPTCAHANEHSCSQLSVHPEVAAPLEVLCTSCRAERIKRKNRNKYGAYDDPHATRWKEVQLASSGWACEWSSDFKLF